MRLTPTLAWKILASALVLAWAGWALPRQFSGASWAGLKAALLAQPGLNLAAAGALTALSFAALAMYDQLASSRVAPGRVPARVAWLAGAAGNAVSNTLGFHALTGTVVRIHVYRRFGLSTREAARIIALSWLALGLGFLAMLALAELVQAVQQPAHAPSALAAGVGITAGLAGLVAWLGRADDRQLTCFGFNQPLPSARLALLQMLIGAVESAAAIGALYILLPPDLRPPYSVFSVACIAAVTAGIAAHVPGGLGVFEAGITAFLSGAGRVDLLAALMTYRFIYNVLPFGLSVLALALFNRGAATRHLSSMADSV